MEIYTNTNKPAHVTALLSHSPKAVEKKKKKKALNLGSPILMLASGEKYTVLLCGEKSASVL